MQSIDKAKFVEAAPVYYALAISVYLVSSGDTSVYREDIIENWRRNETAELDEYDYVRDNIVLDKALEWLAANELIEAIDDIFGPSIFQRADNFKDQFAQLCQQRDTLFGKYNRLGNKGSWLRSALESLNSTYDALDISTADFESDSDEWQPLPLERGSEELNEAIQSLDRLINEIRADNGYAVVEPGERDYVIETLSNASNHLKHATTVTLPYLRTYVFEPLAIVAKRFKDAAISLSATAAKEAVIELIKQYGHRAIEFVLRNL